MCYVASYMCYYSAVLCAVLLSKSTIAYADMLIVIADARYKGTKTYNVTGDKKKFYAKVIGWSAFRNEKIHHFTVTVQYKQYLNTKSSLQ